MDYSSQKRDPTKSTRWKFLALSSRNLIVDLTKTPFPRLWRIFYEKIGKFPSLLRIILYRNHINFYTRNYNLFLAIKCVEIWWKTIKEKNDYSLSTPLIKSLRNVTKITASILVQGTRTQMDSLIFNEGSHINKGHCTPYSFRRRTNETLHSQLRIVFHRSQRSLSLHFTAEGTCTALENRIA